MNARPSEIAASMLKKHHELTKLPLPDDYVVLASLHNAGTHVRGKLLAIPREVRAAILSYPPPFLGTFEVFVVEASCCFAFCATMMSTEPPFATISSDMLSEADTFEQMVYPTTSGDGLNQYCAQPCSAPHTCVYP